MMATWPEAAVRIAIIAGAVFAWWVMWHYGTK